MPCIALTDSQVWVLHFKKENEYRKGQYYYVIVNMPKEKEQLNIP